MSDIVQRLRELADAHAGSKYTVQTLMNAADEIERLRGELVAGETPPESVPEWVRDLRAWRQHRRDISPKYRKSGATPQQKPKEQP